MRKYAIVTGQKKFDGEKLLVARGNAQIAAKNSCVIGYDVAQVNIEVGVAYMHSSATAFGGKKSVVIAASGTPRIKATEGCRVYVGENCEPQLWGSKGAQLFVAANHPSLSHFKNKSWFAGTYTKLPAFVDKFDLAA